MADIFDLNGRRAIVTGGARGIGAAIVRALARSGVRVAIADLDLAAAQGARRGDRRRRRGVRNRCSRSHIDGAGVRRARSPSRRARHPRRQCRRVDDAARRSTSPTRNGSSISPSMRAAFSSATRSPAAIFSSEKRAGAIVNTASLAGKVGAPLLAHYSASKFAVLGWTQALAREMAPHDIRVNAVCPGFVRTSMQEREIIWEGELRGMTPDAVRAEYVSLTPMGAHRGAGGRRRRRAVPRLRRRAVHDGAGDQCDGRRADGLAPGSAGVSPALCNLAAGPKVARGDRDGRGPRGASLTAISDSPQSSRPSAPTARD